MMKFVVVAALAGMAAAECPNGCSGHGTCGLYDACTCYRNWQANDCSERVCPFGKAFVDSPLGDMDGDGDVQGTNDGQAATDAATDGGIVWTKYTNTNNNHNADDANTAGYDTDFATLVPSCSSSASGASAACKAGLAVYERWPYKYDATHGYGADQTLSADSNTLDPTDGSHALTTASLYRAEEQEGHFYRECSNKGVCDRKSGECDCFDGYQGSACQRTTCPNDCSGHGTCEYMRELADGKRIAAPDAPSPTLGNRNMACTTLIADTDGDGDMDIVRNDGTCGWIEGDADDNHGTQYSLWDEESQMGCRCDAGFSGPDCSSKKCPLGDDPLTRGASVTGATGATAIGFNIHGGALVSSKNSAPSLDGRNAQGAAVTAVDDTPATKGPGNIGFAGIELAGSHLMAINDQADADFMVLLGRGLKAGDWINIDDGADNANTYCRIKSLDDTNDPYLTTAAPGGTRAGEAEGTATQDEDTTPTERHFDGNDDGKIDQIVCHASAEYPQLITNINTDITHGVAATIDARQVDEVQEVYVKVGTASKIYYTSLDTGKEYEVGVVSAVDNAGACNTATSTSNGVVENMFEAIPNAVVPGLIVTGPTAATPTATGAACKYAITFTHNPGALHPIRAETHILSSDADGSSVGELEGTQYKTTAVTGAAAETGPPAVAAVYVTFDATHVTADGVGDTLDITTEHYYKMTFPATTELADLPAGSRLRIEGSQWNDGWFTVGHITPLTTQVYVIEPVVDEDASESTLNLHLPIITAFTKKSVVGTKEAVPCSGRGLCDGSTGTCECFRGSTGIACDRQTALEA